MSVALIVKKYAALGGVQSGELRGAQPAQGFRDERGAARCRCADDHAADAHHSEKMVHRYIEQGNIFKENPLNKMYKK